MGSRSGAGSRALTGALAGTLSARRTAKLAATTLAFAISASAAVAQAACTENTVWLRGDFGTARFSVSIADSGAERAQGLMFVESMPQGQGMLFVYPNQRPLAFWMKNTLIPLDIIFADSSGTVVSVAANAIPGDETPLPSASPAQYVLEINGGLAAQMGIGPGTEMRHPRINNPDYPC